MSYKRIKSIMSIVLCAAMTFGCYSMPYAATEVVEVVEDVEDVEEEVISIDEDAVVQEDGEELATPFEPGVEIKELVVGTPQTINLDKEDTDNRYLYYSFEVTKKSVYSLYSKTGKNIDAALYYESKNPGDPWEKIEFENNYFIENYAADAYLERELDCGTYYVSLCAITYDEANIEWIYETVTGGEFGVVEGRMPSVAFVENTPLSIGVNEVAIKAGEKRYYTFEVTEDDITESSTFYFCAENLDVRHNWLNIVHSHWDYDYNAYFSAEFGPGIYCLEAENIGDEDKAYNITVSKKDFWRDANMIISEVYVSDNVLYPILLNAYDNIDADDITIDSNDEYLKITKEYNDEYDEIYIWVKGLKTGDTKLKIGVSDTEHYSSWEKEIDVHVYSANHTHDYQSIVSEQNCAECRRTEYVCSICSNNYDVLNEDGPILGHDMVYSDEYEEYICSRCGFRTNAEEFEVDDTIINIGETILSIPEIEHHYYRFVPKKTCVYKLYSSTSAEEDHHYAYARLYDDKKCLIANASTGCFSEGYEASQYGDFKTLFKFEKGKTYYLAVMQDGADKLNLHIKEHEHTWRNETIVKGATCSEPGKKVLTCAFGCEEKKDIIVPATGVHSYGKWTVSKKATAIAEGSKSRKCLVCKHTETKSIAKLKATIKLINKTVPMKVGQKVNFKIDVYGLAEGDSIKSWSSSNKKVAKVDKRGNVTAVKTGSAKIRVVLASGKKADITVKVQKDKVTTKSITNLPKQITLKKGKKQKLNPILNPISSTDKITYSTSNKKVVTVSGKGEIKAVKKGKATITVKAGKKSFKISVKVK